MSPTPASSASSATAPGIPSSPEAAPTPASWVFAEDFAAEGDAATQARVEAEPLGLEPLSRGTVTALTFLARAVQARAVVEIGTGTGQSGLALFAGMQPDGILTSVDLEADHQRQARKVFGSVGIPSQRFRLIAGDALTVLPKLSDGAYDLVLVAGDTLEYGDYVEQGLRLLRHGGLLIVTHTLWHGQTADTAQDDDETLSVRSALEAVSDNEDLVATLLPVGDGLLAAVKR
ncbi:O-methyltransferase [Microlunatus flavus]|uniref:Predicted O-methyltransferase YrrM n=1 Tax=Microlunatus flavus TaxID=1036181 RepID=A0A1H9KEE7_9ACTN|nr:class I SAM-dependent methyltransferase [Microlunatus flavus]SEQ97524.1 Predicted O-methyltransferase YrrM [Microlunatus flavus]